MSPLRIEASMCHCGSVWLTGATPHFDVEGARHTPTVCFEAP